jgi:hypothetical protein
MSLYELARVQNKDSSIPESLNCLFDAVLVPKSSLGLGNLSLFETEEESCLSDSIIILIWSNWSPRKRT